MQGRTAKEQRLVKTMAAFFKAREEDRCHLLNGKMPPKQAKAFDSILKQAAAFTDNNKIGNAGKDEVFMANSFDDALLKVVAILAQDGISTSIRSTGAGLIAAFEDGFYKSDGCAHLAVENGRLYLFARYKEKTEINSVDDVVRCSQGWYEYSKDRFAGWAAPAGNWAALYERLNKP